MRTMLVFLTFVALIAFAGINVWSLVSGRRLSSKQVAPPEAVRCRSGGGLLLILVMAAVVGQGAAEAVERFGVVLLVALLIGAGLLIAGEVIERRRDAGTVTSLNPRLIASDLAERPGPAIDLGKPRVRNISLGDDTSVHSERQTRGPDDETKAIRLPRSR